MPLVSAVLVLLALVALASGGERSLARDGTAPSGLPDAFWDYSLTLFLAVAALALGVYVWGLATVRERVPLRRRSALASYISLGVLILFVLLFGRAIENAFEQARERPVAETDLAVTPGESRPQTESRPYEPSIRWPLLIGLAFTSALAVTGFVLLDRRRRRGTADAGELVDEVTELVDETLDDLRADPDPRRAVIAAYARMERALAAHGLPREPFEAPLEYLDRASEELLEPLPLVCRLLFDLTYLFERARFSQHAIDAEMKEEAVQALEGIRAQLGAGA